MPVGYHLVSSQLWYNTTIGLLTTNTSKYLGKQNTTDGYMIMLRRILELTNKIDDCRKKIYKIQKSCAHKNTTSFANTPETKINTCADCGYRWVVSTEQAVPMDTYPKEPPKPEEVTE